MNNVIKFLLFSSVMGVGISYGPLYLYHISITINILFLMIKAKKNKYELNFLKNTRLHYFFYFFIGWYTFSLIWSMNTIYSLRYIFYILCGVFISLSLFYFISTTRRFEILLKIIIGTVIFEVMVSTLEIFTSFRWPISPFSPYTNFFLRPYSFEQNFSDFQLTYLKSLPTGFAWNPNNLAVVMCMFFPFFVLYPNKIMKFISLLMLIIILLSGSRLSVISVFIMICFIFIIKRKFILPIFISSIFLIGNYFLESISNTLLSFKFSELLGITSAIDAFFSSTAEEGTSVGTRKTLIINALDALKNSYGIGVGAGNSLTIQENLGSSVTSLHNFWIELLVEGGVFFFAIFVVWYFLVLLNLIKIYIYCSDSSMRYKALSIFVSLFGFLFSAISASSVIYVLPMWIVFGLAISLINISKSSMSINERGKGYAYWIPR